MADSTIPTFDDDPPPLDSFVPLRDLLVQADVRPIPLHHLADWTAAQHVEGEKWAREQLAANEQADPGTSVSVRWPDHVAAAHHAQEEPMQTPSRKRVSRSRAPKSVAEEFSGAVCDCSEDAVARSLGIEVPTRMPHRRAVAASKRRSGIGTKPKAGRSEKRSGGRP